MTTDFSLILQRIVSIILTAIAVSFGSSAFGQNSDAALTAAQIIQRAIDSSGGDKNFEIVRNVETISQVVTSKGDTLCFSVKRMNFDKYFVSTLSLGYVNTTTVYNKGRAALVSEQNVKEVLDPVKLEELQLQSYLSLEYGYKKLGYTFKREADQKFQHFECFTILVSSPFGITTINYYDKKTGKLIMVIYPNMNRSVFIDFYKAKGITCASKILMVDNSGAITESTMTSLNYDENLDSNWFNVPVTAVHKVPETFKMGTFRYVDVNDGSKIVREKNKQFEISGESKIAYNLEWTSDNDYLINRLKNASIPPTNDNIEFVKVRIIGWTKNRYYCQYITSSNSAGTCVFEKVD